MSRTPYSKANGDFSEQAHLAAQTLVYPEIFQLPYDRLTFESTLVNDGAKGAVLDGDMAIDKIVKVTAIHDKFRQPIQFTVQERFRKMEFMKWQDITITEWNHRSGLPSELYKLAANLFVYGYFDPATETFGDAVAVNVTSLLYKLCNGELQFGCKKNPRSDQDFITVKLEALWQSGVTIYWQSKAMLEGLTP